MEFLEIQERISLSVRIGESSVREFKSALQGRPGHKEPRPAKDIMVDVARTLVAFANSDGGELLVGVEDDGDITGVPHKQEIIEAILNASESHIHQDTPLPTPRKGVVEIDNNVVIYFAISKGTQYVHLTRDGRCIRRLDRESVPVSSEEIRAKRLEDGSRAWDRQIAPGATLEDLDLSLLEEVSNQITYGVSREKSLQYLELAEFGLDGLILKRAAMLLFAKDVRQWHPGCYVRILIIDGKEQRSGENYNIVSDQIITDNMIKLIDRAWENLNIALSRQPKFTQQAEFHQTYSYPQVACREALINAIVHRNYMIEGRGIEISIYTDRMEIKSPGMLLSTISLEDLTKLTGAHESRNPLVARVLRELGFVREMGEGIRRIFDVMRSNALAEPELNNSNQGFSVTLYHRSMYDPRVKLWLSNFDDFKLTESQKAIMALGFGGNHFSVQEIIDRLGIIDIGEVTKIITPLRQWGLVERTMNSGTLYKEAKRLRIPKREVKSYRVVNNPEDGQEIDDDEFENETIQADFFVHNIEYRVSREELYDFLSKFGQVISLSLPRDRGRPNQNKGYSFVTLEITTTEQDLMDTINGQQLKGRRLFIKKQK